MLNRLFRSLVTKALRSQAGNVAIIFAVSMPLVIGGAGLGVETTYWRYKQVQLQAAADAASYAAAVEKRRGSGDATILLAAKTAMTQNGFSAPATAVSLTYPATVGGVAAPNAVRVQLETKAQRFFTAYFSNSPVNVAAAAVANYTMTSDSCILALDPSASSAIDIWGSSQVTLQGCSIMANSISAQAVTSGGSSKTKVSCLVSGGGVALSGSVTLTDCDKPVTDAAPAADPYKTRVLPPPPGSCNKAKGNAATLSPGYYCDMNFNQSTTLQSGIYYTDQLRWNGAMTISDDGKGGVTIVLLNGGRADMNGNATVKLSAMTSGPTKGILFWGDRTSTAGDDNVFNGTADSLMTGALYFPSQAVEYKGNFSGINGCTQVVANTVQWIGNATISQDCSSLGIEPVPIPGAVKLIG